MRENDKHQGIMHAAEILEIRPVGSMATQRKPLQEHNLPEKVEVSAIQSSKFILTDMPSTP